MTPSSPDDIYRRATVVDETAVADRVILYHRLTGTAVVLNPVGSFIWTLLDGRRRPRELAAALAKRFSGLTADRAGADVTEYLADLARYHFVDLESDVAVR